jgi:hypothetical protein
MIGGSLLVLHEDIMKTIARAQCVYGMVRAVREPESRAACACVCCALYARCGAVGAVTRSARRAACCARRRSACGACAARCRGRHAACCSTLFVISPPLSRSLSASVQIILSKSG